MAVSLAPSEPSRPTERPDRVDTVIVGAGVAGLTLARLLDEAGERVCLVEASAHVGGAIRTHREDGYLVERGPNTVLATHPEVGQLLDLAGVRGERVAASPNAKKRFVVRGGRPVPMPMSPGEFIKTPLFSGRAKFRLLKEPFIGRREDDREESVAEFVRRRLGDEFLDYAIDPFVSGVYAGRPEHLSVLHAFPRLAEVEARYGSLIRGQILGARERRRRADTAKTEAGMFSLKGGLDGLAQALADSLGDAVRTEHRVDRVHRVAGAWRINATGPDGPVLIQADRLIVASGLRSIDWWAGFGADLGTLQSVQYPPLTVCALGFRQDDVAHPLDGFGMLVPRVEKRSILGALFPSTLFPNRAPEGHVLITAFVGGSRNPDLAGLPADVLRERVLDDLDDLLGTGRDPVYQDITHWPAAIPQYRIGYGRIKAELDRLEAAHDGLYFAGNYRAGISVPDTIRFAYALAKRVLNASIPAAS